MPTDRPQAPFSRDPSRPAGKGLAGSWKRRLQHVSLRTKIVVPMVILAVAPALAVGVLTISTALESLRQDANDRLRFDATSKARVVEEFLLGIQHDLRSLRQIEAVRALVRYDHRAAGATAPSTVNEEFLAFFQRTRMYCQVQCLNPSGQEVIRLDAETGEPVAARPDQLKDQNDQRYVKEALALQPDQLYVSPMNLVEEPHTKGMPPLAVVRYAGSIVEDGRRHGLLVLSVCVHHLLSRVGLLPAGTEAWLLDGSGIYLGYVGESMEKRQRYHLEHRRSLWADYRPEDVAAILRGSDEGLVMETSTSFLSSAKIAFDESNSSRYWTLLISHAQEPVEAPIRRLTWFLSMSVFVAIVFAGTTGLFVAHYLTRPLASLRRATREIAAGNLSKRVEITTGDEIEAFAVGFNTMTVQLRKAQDRLSTWNEELEQEVARQTDRLRRLQGGLARTDKLASIGQMTAGVMHEIGNPLAAIKTKIQVAEEAGSLCENCHVLLSGIVGEVDRLATFLRSFSRLSRLQEPQFTEVHLDDVVHGVVTLVGPELQQRGINLHVEALPGTPQIRGDATQLRQLLINLVLNAAEASPDGASVLIRVRRAAAATHRTDARIEVRDHGRGIPEEIIHRIWDPFFTTSPQGTGLGLGICRQIVRDHDGTIEIESTSGAGTLFTITFPGRPETREGTSAREAS